jgi:hypothetical protein
LATVTGSGSRPPGRRQTCRIPNKSKFKNLKEVKNMGYNYYGSNGKKIL